MPLQRLKDLVRNGIMGIDARIASRLYKQPRPAGAIDPSMNDQQIRELVRQGLRWAFAAAQDSDLVVAHLHSTYAVAWFDIVAEAASAERIQALTGVNIREVREGARALQDRAQRALIQLEHPGLQLPAAKIVR
jgi:hypothetical protein